MLSNRDFELAQNMIFPDKNGLEPPQVLLSTEYYYCAKIFKDLDFDFLTTESKEEIEKNISAFFQKHPRVFKHLIKTFLSSYKEAFDSEKYEKDFAQIAAQQSSLMQSLPLSNLIQKTSESISKLKKLPFKEGGSHTAKQIFNQINNLNDHLELQKKLLMCLVNSAKFVGDTSLYMNVILDDHSKIFSFLIKFLLAFSPPKDAFCLETYSSVMFEIAQFIYHHAANLLEDQTSAILHSLSFFIMAEIENDPDVLLWGKNLCYLSLLNEKKLPNKFDLTEYCRKNPKKYIELFELLQRESLFGNILDTALWSKNLDVTREYVKLHLLAAKAYRRENQINSANRYTKFAKVKMTELLTKQDEAGILFLERDCFDDFSVMVFLAVYYANEGKNNDKSKKFVIRASELFDTLDKQNYQIDEVLLMARLLVMHESSGVERDKGIFILFDAAKTTSSRKQALGYLEELALKDKNIALLLGKFFLDTLDDKKMAQRYFSHAIGGAGTHEANYYLYLLDKNETNKLLDSAKGGYQPAINELENLATQDKEFCVHLGLMYLKGYGVKKDDQLAGKYLLEADVIYKKDGKVKFELARLILEQRFQTDAVDPVELLSQVIMMNSSPPPYLAAGQLEILLERNGIDTHAQYKASLVLMRYYHALKRASDDYRKAAEFATLCCKIDPKQTSWSIMGKEFLTAEFRCHVNDDLFISLFQQYENFCENQKQVLPYLQFSHEFLIRSESNMDVAQFLIGHVKLRENIDLDILKGLFKTLYDKRQETAQLLTAITDLIAIPKYSKSLFKWLEENKPILLALLNNNMVLGRLSENADWKKFINSRTTVNFLKSNALFTERRFSFQTVFSFFEKSQVETKLLETIQDAYHKKKQDICSVIIQRITSLEAKNEEPKKITQLKEFLSDLNIIDNTSGLVELIRKLAMCDIYFEIYLPKDEIKKINSFQAS